MVVQHNLTAMNSNRMLGITTGQQAKSSEKLSSGYQINRAADDAAGLTISEKMRKQINGLDRASTNAEDGVSAVQTAEGALTEVHSMLQRMNELAVQAANGTNSENDRDAIQAEIDQLTTEIDRVAETTKFNELYMLKGNAAGTSSEQKVAAHDAGLAGKLTDRGNGTTVFQLDKALADGDKVTIAGKEYTIGTQGKGTVLDPKSLNTKTDGYKKFDDAATFKTNVLTAGDSVTYGENTYTLTDNYAADAITWQEDDVFTVGEIKFTVDDTTVGVNQEADIDEAAGTATIGSAKAAEYIEQALAEGKQVKADTFTANVYSKNGTAAKITATDLAGKSITLVSELAEGEVSSVQLGTSVTVENLVNAGEKIADGDDYLALKAGDSITKDGETTVATSETPTAAKDVYDAIDAIGEDDGAKVAIGEGLDQITYDIVAEDEVDVDNNKITKEMLLSKIQDGETVAIDNDGDGTADSTQTVIGDIGSPSTNMDVISAKTAYAMMAEELEKASSIGADTAAEVTNDGDGKFTIKQGSVEVKDSLSFNLHVGADADMTNKITVDIDAMDAAGLGIKGLSVAGETGAPATYAIDAIADAISKVSSQRSALGAVQNRLEHTIANLDNVVENTTAAESRIRDTDMASEMVEFSKNNILAQAGQSMLAQANQSTQGVLSLLG